MTLSGVIGGGAQNLTIEGSCTVALSGTNTYSGTTTITDSGTLQLGVSNALSDSTEVTVNSGATFDLNDNSDTVASSADAGEITLGSGTLTSGGDNTSTEVSGIISESGGITKVGSGTLTLSADNTYSGTTNVNAGTLLISGQTDSATMNIASGATLEFNVASGTRDNGSDTEFTGTGTLVKSGDGILRWTTPTVKFALGSGGLIDIQGGTLVSGSFADDIWTSNLSDLNVASGAIFNGVEANVLVDALTGAGTLHIGNDTTTGSITSNITNNSVIIFDRSNAISYSDVISGTGSVAQNGSGNLTLSGINTYTGGTTVNDGTLTLTAGGATDFSNMFASGVNVTINSDDNFDTGGHTT